MRWHNKHVRAQPRNLSAEGQMNGPPRFMMYVCTSRWTEKWNDVHQSEVILPPGDSHRLPIGSNSHEGYLECTSHFISTPQALLRLCGPKRHGTKKDCIQHGSWNLGDSREMIQSTQLRRCEASASCIVLHRSSLRIPADWKLASLVHYAHKTLHCSRPIQ